MNLQLSFEGISQSEGWPTSRQRGSAETPPELVEFHRQERLRAMAAATADGRVAYIKFLVKYASSMSGSEITVGEFFDDFDLVARVILVPFAHDDTAEQIKSGSRTKRRDAVKAFLRDMEDFTGRDADEAIAALEAAMRANSDEDGLRWKQPPTRTNTPDTYTPPAEDVWATLAELGRPHGVYGAMLAKRNTAFYRYMAESGDRLETLIVMDCADLIRTSSGLSSYIHEKGKRELWPQPIGRELSDAIDSYIVEVNKVADKRKLPRLTIGKPGRLWRNRWGQPWDDQAAYRVLQRAAAATGVRPFGPHALRRSLSIYLLRHASRQPVAKMMRRAGTRVQDIYYSPKPGSSFEDWPAISWADCEAGVGVA